MLKTNDIPEETLLFYNPVFFRALEAAQRKCYYIGKDPLKEEYFI